LAFPFDSTFKQGLNADVRFISRNPATEKLMKRHRPHTNAEIQTKIRRLHLTHADWSQLSWDERWQILNRVMNKISAQTEALALTITREMGKPISQARAEVQKSLTVLAAYRTPLSDQAIGNEAMIRAESLGVILGIMPWNFPVWQLLRMAVPALLTGNTVLVKHAPNVLMTSSQISQIFHETYPGIFEEMVCGTAQVHRVIADPVIQGVSLTGSVAAGQAVATTTARFLKKTVLELGGSDPAVVLEDADLDQAVEGCLAGRLVNSGQSCVASKRFFVHASLSKRFCEALKDRLRTIPPLHPELEDSQLGPLARSDLREQLHRQILKSVRQGARLELGGIIPRGKGYYYPSTLLTNVTAAHEVFREETFGPVFAVMSFRNESEALRAVLTSRYGLGASVYSQSREKQEFWARQFCAGVVGINQPPRSDPRWPFGGRRESGIGRELGPQGLTEFINWKSVIQKEVTS
jgi:succinate-semialdehyde dehydrogenase/glutarate-semialdehyde dehydrogenase